MINDQSIAYKMEEAFPVEETAKKISKNLKELRTEIKKRYLDHIKELQELVQECDDAIQQRK